MSIKPVHFNGMMQRSQDVSAVKHNEDQKPVIQQENIQTSFQKKTDGMVKTVTQPNKKQEAKGHFDAKEEGKNKYFSRKKQQSYNQPTDKVVEKNMSSGFDVMI